MHTEALIIGIKEGIKVYVCLFLVTTYLKSRDWSYLNISFYAGLLTVLGCSFYLMTVPADPWIRDAIVRMTGYVFGLFYLGSLIALYHETGDDMLGPLKRLGAVRPISFLIVFIITLLYFSPDMTGTSFYLQDLYTMGGGSFVIIASGAFGFLTAVVISWKVSKYISAEKTGLLRLSQVFLLLALIKLVSGGIKGFTELSLIPSVQAGLVKLSHDLIHHVLVTLMVPDHQMLSLTAWNFLGFFFSKETTLWLSLALLSIPLCLFLIRQYREAISVPGELKIGALRRKYVRSVKDIRLVRAVPIGIFIVIIVVTWFSEKGDTGASLYNPEPVPVIAADRKIILPIKGPGTDLLDGMLHKYSLSLNGETVRVMVLKKHDGTLAATLDACEICPPDGYAQDREHVVCLYCNTPIAIDTIGKPGGCNPIPLAAEITDTDVRINMEEIGRKWKIVKKTGRKVPVR